MIHVIANIELKPGFRDEFIQIFKANVPAVLREDGCIAYAPCVSVDSGIPAQGAVNENLITVVEAWESIDHLLAHLQAPHMKAYVEKTKEMKVKTTLQIVEPA